MRIRCVPKFCIPHFDAYALPHKRLARYPLLFEQVLVYSDNEDNNDVTDLREGVSVAKKVLKAANEQIKQRENEQKLAHLSDHLIFSDDPSISIDLTSATQHLGKRQLIKEGPLQRSHRHRRASKRKDLYVYLFNDMLLMTLQPRTSDVVTTDDSQGVGHNHFIVAYRVVSPSAAFRYLSVF